MSEESCFPGFSSRQEQIGVAGKSCRVNQVVLKARSLTYIAADSAVPVRLVKMESVSFGIWILALELRRTGVQRLAGKDKDWGDLHRIT
jgi:hypothetical protein